MSAVRSEFINLQLFLNPPTLEALKVIPHQIHDAHGTLISQSMQGEATSEPKPLELETVCVGKIKSSPELLNSTHALISAAIKRESQSMVTQSENEWNNLLARDIQEISLLVEKEGTDITEILNSFLKCLRGHVWTERASIFGIYDGFTLEGLAGIGGDSTQKNWKLDFSSLAGTAATSRKTYHSENPGADPAFVKKDGVAVPRNLVCVPLINGTLLVGVLNLSNRIGGPFTEKDHKIINRMAQYLARLLHKHFLKNRVKSLEKSSDNLGKYLSSKIAKGITSATEIELGGVERKVVCLFSDIRGYTTLSEGVDPTTLIKLLNFYFEVMSEVIEKHEGTVDKIVGDLIMALWNIPNDQPEPELKAMRAAIDMQKEMIRKVVPEWLKYGISNVGMGIGVNAGVAVAGNLGSQRFMNYTVIGDAINTSQRLEAKARSGEVWMAEHVFEHVDGKIEKPIRKEINIKLKGKDQLLSAYVYKPLSH